MYGGRSFAFLDKIGIKPFSFKSNIGLEIIKKKIIIQYAHISMDTSKNFKY